MTGLIWTIQLVHYPSFHHVDKSNFVDFESFHAFRISLIVLPVMVAELLSGGYLVYKNPDHRFLWLNLMGLGVIWLVTLFVSSQLHGQLGQQGYVKELVVQLVSTNWYRTLLWSLRLGLLFFLLHTSFQAHQN